jgi:hypothetical protein
MERDEVAQLVQDIERSIEMRRALQEKLSNGGRIDLVQEWEAIERLDHGITRQIRKRPPE